MGINVESSPYIHNYPTTFTKEINNKFDKMDIVNSLITSFFHKYIKVTYSKNNSILDEFKKKLMFLNKEVNIEVGNKINLRGIFEDINLDVSMKININGNIENIYSARIVNDSN